MNKKLFFSTSVSAIVSLSLLTAMIVLREFVKPFNVFITSITGHHWVTKSLFTVILFLILLAVLYYSKKGENVEPEKGLYGLIITTIVSFIIMTVTFVVHFMMK